MSASLACQKKKLKLASCTVQSCVLLYLLLHCFLLISVYWFSRVYNNMELCGENISWLYQYVCQYVWSVLAYRYGVLTVIARSPEGSEVTSCPGGLFSGT